MTLKRREEAFFSQSVNKANDKVFKIETTCNLLWTKTSHNFLLHMKREVPADGIRSSSWRQ